MKIIFFLTLFCILVLGDILKVATYNVENLFDLKKNGHEYKEYIPYTYSQWNKKNYTIKLYNIAKVIKDIDADIIGLEEIESLQALKDLRYTLKRKGLYYRYYAIANLKDTTVKVALLSKIPFLYKHEIAVQSSYKYRNILEVKFKLKNGENLYILVNHWKSKSGPESMRLVSAKALYKRVKELGYDKNIIALGDFNSHYEEYKSFKRKRRLNDTENITGINHILGTINYQDKAEKIHLKNGEFYNLWYDTKKNERYTHIYKKHKEALDSILITKSLLNTKGILYLSHSIHTFKTSYLFKKNHIYRWQMTRRKKAKHKGKGYSDHLPLVAKFSY
jgi:endonuclease/exonuclease/phosphatase family metal-dependent hydrolase